MRLFNQQSDLDCFRCCLATVLDRDYADVPDFYGDRFKHNGTPRQAWDDIQEWLKHNGLVAVELPVNTLFAQPLPDKATVILTGPSPRIDGDHCVVGRWNRSKGVFETVHDPHPSHVGLKTISTYTFISLNPEGVR